MSTSTSAATTNDSGPMEGLAAGAGAGSVKHKRSAERQLTKDDDPDGDDNADSGAAGDLTAPFRKADDQVLKTRRILKARRPVTGSSTGTSTGSSSAAAVTTTTAAAAASEGTTTSSTSASSPPSNPFASTTLVVEPLPVQPVVQVPASDTCNITPSEPKLQPAGNEELTKDTVDDVQVTHSAPETSTTATSNNSAEAKATTPPSTSTSTASNPGPFKVFGSFAGFGGGFPTTTTGFGTAATTNDGTNNKTDTSTTGASTTGFAFASTSSSTFGSAPNTTGTTSATTGSIFGSVSSNSFSFGFANQTNGEPQTISPKVTLPESVELTTGEEEELNLHDCRCKTFKWVPAVETEESTPAETKTTLSVKPSKDFQIQISDAAKDDAAPHATTNQQSATDNNNNKTGDEKQHQESKESPNFRWQELGVGPMKLLQDNSDPPKYRLVQRRESSPNGPATKVLLNLPLYKESKVSLKAGQENYLSFITIGHDGRNETYLWKFKEVSQAQMFARFLEGILPHARSCFVGDK